MRFITSKALADVIPLFGIIAPILFIVTDLAAGFIRKNYSFVYQSMNELSAVGAPTRPYVVSLNIVGYVLVIVFGLAVWKLGGHNPALRILAILAVGFGVFNLIGIFFPMQVGKPPSTINVVIGALGVFSLVLAIPVAAFAFNGWFRIASIVLASLFVLLTIFGLYIAPRMGGYTTTPIGLQERTMMYLTFSWLAALAFAL